MPEKNLTIALIPAETKKTKRGKDFWNVLDTDGVAYSVWTQKLLDAIRERLNQEITYDVTEKTFDNTTYYTIEAMPGVVEKEAYPGGGKGGGYTVEAAKIIAEAIVQMSEALKYFADKVEALRGEHSPIVRSLPPKTDGSSRL